MTCAFGQGDRRVGEDVLLEQCCRQDDILYGSVWPIASAAVVRVAMFGVWHPRATLVLNHQSH